MFALIGFWATGLRASWTSNLVVLNNIYLPINPSSDRNELKSHWTKWPKISLIAANMRSEWAATLICTNSGWDTYDGPIIYPSRPDFCEIMCDGWFKMASFLVPSVLSWTCSWKRGCIIKPRGSQPIIMRTQVDRALFVTLTYYMWFI